jgi:hypothetical protein
MQDGDRVLTEAEWALFRTGLGELWDLIEDEGDQDGGLSETGVRVFDALQADQKLALLADVGTALSDPLLPTPRHTAANEGAIAAVFATVRQALEEEIASVSEEGATSTKVRSLLLAAADSEDTFEDIPEPSEEDAEEWGWVLDSVEDRIFWDADYEMGDEFLDRPPDEARELLARMGIDSEYYLADPREPDEAGLVAVRQTLARLLGRPVPDDDGLYPALDDLYHCLVVGPCTRQEIDACANHPWLREVRLCDPEWDCGYQAWVAAFKDAVPASPFTLPTGGLVAPGGGGNLPGEVRVVQRGGAWVVRDGRGDFWCDALGNGWADSPDEDGTPALAFPSREEAEAAYRKADRMYTERATRHQAAVARLGRPCDTV